MISFKIQDFSHTDAYTRCLGKVLSVFHHLTIGCAPVCLLVFLGLERMVFLLALSREGAIRLFSWRTPHRSMTLVSIESQVLIKGVMHRQVLF